MRVVQAWMLLVASSSGAARRLTYRLERRKGERKRANSSREQQGQAEERGGEGTKRPRLRGEMPRTRKHDCQPLAELRFRCDKVKRLEVEHRRSQKARKRQHTPLEPGKERRVVQCPWRCRIEVPSMPHTMGTLSRRRSSASAKRVRTILMVARLL